MAFQLTLASLVCAIFWGATQYFFYRFTQQGVALGLPADHIFFQFIRSQQIQMNWIFALTATLVAVAISIWGLLMSHRVSGPLYRLKIHLEKMTASGNLSPVKFRDKDYFPELAESFNKFMTRIQSGK